MEPEGTKIDSTTTKALPSGVLSGKAIFTYRKPVFTAFVISNEVDDKEQAEDDTASTTSDSGDSPDWPELTQAKTFECTEDYEETDDHSQSWDEGDDDDNDADQWLFSSIYKYSLIIGLLVGCFIQSSSLGANYILMIVYGRDFEVMAQHQQHVVFFSLTWSFLTSLMGIAILLILRSLISLAGNGLNSNGNNKNNTLQRRLGSQTSMFSFPQLSLVAYLEFPFAFGALAGVCGSWACTDFVLGLESHAYHSLVTLGVAYFGKMIFELCARGSALCDMSFGGYQTNGDNKTQPLLDTPRESPQAKVRRIHKEFKVKGLVIGLIVGFFIQFSSLGASFLIDALANEEKETVTSMMSKQDLLVFSLGWSFIFGTMGVAILLPLRYLIGIVCDHVLSQSQSAGADAEEEEEMADKWSISLEFFFAVGCLVGVNMAWLMTDVGLGLNAHVWRSILTLGAAAVWCVILAYCFGFKRAFATESKEKGQHPMVTRATQTDETELLVV